MVGDSDGGSCRESRWLVGRIQRVFLELSTVFYFFARNAAIPLVQQYIYHLVARKYNLTGAMADAIAHVQEGGHKTIIAERSTVTLGPPAVSGGGQAEIIGYPTDDVSERVENTWTEGPVMMENERMQTDHVLQQVSEESSLIILYLTVAELLPAAIVVLFLGSWSDASGRRKFLMWLPCVGNALYAIGFLLPGYINGSDIDHPATMALFVGASVLSGLSGSVPGFLSGNAGYISDTDSPRRRTLRLAIVELSIGLTFGIASLMNGYWINAGIDAIPDTSGVHRPPAGFEQPLWFVAICSLVPFVIVFFLLREPAGELLITGRPDVAGSTSEIDSISAETLTYFRFRNFRGIRRAFGFATPAQRKLWAIVAAFQVYVFVQQGQERTLVLFLQNPPLRAGTTEIGLQLFVLYGLAGLGSWPGVPLLQRRVDDLAIAAIAMASKMIGSLMTALATNGAVVFAGSVYALVHSMQSVVGFLGPVVHTAIYTGTVSHWSGAVFIVSGLLLIIPLILFGFARYLEKKEDGYQNVDGTNQGNKPFSPSSLTPLSESGGFAQRSDLRGY